MDGGASSFTKPTFFSHVFSTTEESKAELLNTLQYAALGIVPIVVLNKVIQRFVPEADLEKSSLELLVEIFLQIIIMFCGIIVIHRIITYIPTYSGFRYESLTLTNTILAFLIIILSIQSKLGLKVNIIYDRIMTLWNGEDTEDTDPKNKRKSKKKKDGANTQSSGSTIHVPSQGDYLEESGPTTIFPPAPISSTHSGGSSQQNMENYYDGGGGGPLPANGILGGAFGSMF